jgi:hypothetical protein
MKPNLSTSGHSADVRISLCVNGHILSVAQLGPGYVILKDPCDHPLATAEIAMSVDGQERRWNVQLAEGIAAGRLKTKIVGCRPAEGVPFDWPAATNLPSVGISSCAPCRERPAPSALA